jgi:hypothetical protein
MQSKTQSIFLVANSRQAERKEKFLEERNPSFKITIVQL